MSWAELMKRVFDLDVLQCPVCRGPMKVIAEITEPKVIKQFLAAMDLPTEMPEVDRARPPGDHGSCVGRTLLNNRAQVGT